LALSDSLTRLGGGPHTLRTRLIVIGTVAVIAVLLLILVSVGGRLSRAPAPPPQKKATSPDSFTPTPAQLQTLVIAPVAELNFRTELVTDGKIAVNGNTSTPVFSPFSGRVTRILANPGDTVAKGAPLVAVEATEFIQAQNDLIAATAALDAARAQLTQAELIEKRKHALFEAKGGSLQDWQQSQSDLVAAQSAHQSAEIALAAVRNRLRVLGKTEADVKALESTKSMDAAAVVVSPIAGTVTDRQVGLGQYIQSGASTPVFTVSNLSSVWLVGNVREADAPAIRRGMPAEVTVLALPGKVFKAKLAYVAPTVDPVTRRVAVRAEVENPNGELKPEMFATFGIITGGESKAPAIPESAIVYEGQDARIWVEKPDGSLSVRKINVGRNFGNMFEALSGVKAGDKIVTRGTLFIDRAAKGE
jgi:cobalt-zinc-cadmium efflux system membrane fusion protein